MILTQGILILRLASSEFSGSRLSSASKLNTLVSHSVEPYAGYHAGEDYNFD